MDNCLFQFQREQLNAALTVNGQLKLIAGADSLSLLALGNTGEVLALQSWQLTGKKPGNQWFESELPGLIAELEILHMPFAERSCALSSEFVTLVPNRLFFQEELPKYFQLLRPGAENVQWGFEELPGFGCQVVWGAESHFSMLFQGFQPRHLAGALIQAYKKLASEKEKSVFLNIRGNHAQLVVFDDGNLLFFNTFEFFKPSDLLYYVLLVYDQFKLNPETQTLHVSGAMTTDSELYKVLFRYIREIRFLKPDLPAEWPVPGDALPVHYWFDLLSI